MSPSGSRPPLLLLLHSDLTHFPQPGLDAWRGGGGVAGLVPHPVVNSPGASCQSCQVPTGIKFQKACWAPVSCVVPEQKIPSIWVGLSFT